MSASDRLVPKVHPLARDAGPEDPLELMANPVEGDPGVMLECIVAEYAWMGFSPDGLLALFASPEYPVLNQLVRHFGPEEVRRRVEEVLGPLGVVSFTAVVDDAPEPDEPDGPELIQLSTDRVRKG